MALVISACSDSTYEGDADVVTEVARLRLSAGAGLYKGNDTAELRPPAVLILTFRTEPLPREPR